MRFSFLIVFTYEHHEAGVAGRLPQLVPDQVLKLKQLTVLTLAETNKVAVHVFTDFMYRCTAHFEVGYGSLILAFA